MISRCVKYQRVSIVHLCGALPQGVVQQIYNVLNMSVFTGSNVAARVLGLTHDW